MCHHHRHCRDIAQRERVAWDDTTPPASGPVRVGDAARERVVEPSRAHAAS